MSYLLVLIGQEARTEVAKRSEEELKYKKIWWSLVELLRGRFAKRFICRAL